MKKLHVAVPTVLAIVALAAFVRVSSTEAFPDSYVIDSAPTPYSTAHSVVQSRPGPAEEPAPTF